MTAATFLDFDGTLADTNLVHVYAFYARHAGRPGGVLKRHAALLANVPAFYALDAYSRIQFARRLFSMYQGMSRDRLEHLAKKMDEEVISPKVHAYTRDFLDACRSKGPLVLITGALDFSVRHFAERFGFDGVIANRLEYKDGVATGRVIPPEAFGPNKAALMRDYAQAHGIDLNCSSAYADSVSDVSMFEVVQRAGVVNPDARLAAMARDYHWQILTF